MKKFILMLMASLCLSTFATANTQYELLPGQMEIQLCTPQISFEVPTIENDVILLESPASIMLCSPQDVLSFALYADSSPWWSSHELTFTKYDAKHENYAVNLHVPVFLLSRKANGQYLRVALLANTDNGTGKHYLRQKQHI